MSNQEQERLKRLREKQIADRDPQVKQRKVQQNYSVKAKRMRKPFKLTGAWKDLPHIIRTPFYAFLLGIAIIFALPTLWDSPYAIWVALLITVILILFGVIVGNSLDLRDDIRDKLK
jgi:multidrug efflux pump subunit AcrB